MLYSNKCWSRSKSWTHKSLNLVVRTIGNIQYGLDHSPALHKTWTPGHFTQSEILSAIIGSLKWSKMNSMKHSLCKTYLDNSWEGKNMYETSRPFQQNQLRVKGNVLCACHFSNLRIALVFYFKQAVLPSLWLFATEALFLCRVITWISKSKGDLQQQ